MSLVTNESKTRDQVKQQRRYNNTNNISTSSLSPGNNNIDVFLGGSCNPTTWRTEVAIPRLEQLGITYYNPQVSDWNPELLRLENEAKERAEVLFFVLDNQTRSTAAMVEIAHALGRGQQLVLVVNKFWPGTKIFGESISQKECEDLKNCQLYLQDLALSSGVKVYEDIDEALIATAKRLKSGSGSMPQQAMTQRSISLTNESHSSPHHHQHAHYDVVDCSAANVQSIKTGSKRTTNFNYNSKNCNFISASDHDSCNYQSRKDDLLLFLITNTSRCLTETILASYFLGSGEKIVACIQELPPNATIKGEKLSELAIKDYNRGRAYLMDLARAAGTPIFTRARDAVHKYITNHGMNSNTSTST